MTVAAVAIRPRRSMTFFAMFAVVMVVVSYIFILALAAACVYLPFELLINDSNVGTNALFLFLFGLIIAGGLVWSLVPRRDKFEPPGPQLSREQHPRLFAELDAIAASLNEPMPKEVYLTGEVNAWVTDRGGVLGFGSRRVMGLGIPLMSVLTVSQFRAVLAHEFAHYYGGDTSLGPWVYKTKMAMVRTFEAMGSLGGLARFAVLAVMHLVVTTILKWYFMLFLRAINLVSRKQEFRADELAGLVVGAKPLMEGLRVIHGAGPAWGPYFNSEVAELLNSGVIPPVGEGFSRFLAAPKISAIVRGMVQKEIQEGKAGPYDTHPPLRERIAAAEHLPAPALPDDARPARVLLEHPEDTERLLLKTLNPSLETGKLRSVPWERIQSDVTIPMWRKMVSDHGAKFGSIPVEGVPEIFPKLPEIGAQLPDPKGMLLDRVQRTHYAAEIVAVGMSVAMLNDGWELHAEPGEFYFQRGERTLNPFEVMKDLFAGKIKREDWPARCREWGLEQLVIFPQKTVGVVVEAGPV